MASDLSELLPLLSGCRYDPDAERIYDIMRGGFLWRDELPARDSDEYGKAASLLTPITAYRASLSQGEPRKEYEREWRELKSKLPSWPGFREERIYAHQVRRDIRAIRLKEHRYLQRFEEDPAEWDSHLTTHSSRRRSE